MAERRAAPDGMRWATGGGSPVGYCNGYHLARGQKFGTLCGRFGPHTPPDPPLAQAICGSCARIAKVSRAGLVASVASNQEQAS